MTSLFLHAIKGCDTTLWSNCLQETYRKVTSTYATEDAHAYDIYEEISDSYLLLKRLMNMSQEYKEGEESIEQIIDN